MSIRQSISANWAWMGPMVGFAGSVCLALLVFYLGTGGNSSDPESDLVADWNRTISKLGIEPIFPPEEDIYVGDIFAVLTRDRCEDAEAQCGPKSKSEIGSKPGAKSKSEVKSPPEVTTEHSRSVANTPSLNRAVKIGHSDKMMKELKAYYSSLPVFAATKTRPTVERDIWEQTPDDTTFTAGPRKSLALAAFPAFSIKTNSAGSGNLFLPVVGGFGYMQNQKRTEELEIAFAETYGVPTVLASGLLFNYCEDPFTGAVCDEERVREHLSSLVGGMATEPLPNSNRYRFEVQLHFVYRAYLTRAINRRGTVDEVRKANSANDSTTQGATTSTAVESSSAAQAPAPAGNGGPSNAARVNASAESQRGRDLSLDRTFQRPIVFGYRAIKRDFDGVRKSSEQTSTEAK